jgi:hypothetical protein
LIAKTACALQCNFQHAKQQNGAPNPAKRPSQRLTTVLHVLKT